MYSHAPEKGCPACGVELLYTDVAGYRRSRRLNSLCRRCAASPKVIQKKLAEEEERRTAEKLDGNFMAAFFQKIEASLSGSQGR